MMKYLGLSALLALAIVAGCDRDKGANKDSDNPAAPEKAPSHAGLDKAIVLADAPAGAKDIIDAKKTLKFGDEVVLRGVVGGREKPFTDGRAQMMLMDATLKSCKNMGDDCKTPWDYCCESDIPSKAATVQVVDADGKPIKADLRGFAGLKPFSEVVVKGKVAQAELNNLVVNATGVYVKP
jgi:hypothetical protein